MAATDMSERKSTATSGWVFLDGFIAVTILSVGAFVVVSLSAGVGHPFLTTALSYLGSCLVAFLPIIGVFVAVVLARFGTRSPMCHLSCIESCTRRRQRWELASTTSSTTWWKFRSSYS